MAAPPARPRPRPAPGPPPAPPPAASGLNGCVMRQLGTPAPKLFRPGAPGGTAGDDSGRSRAAMQPLSPEVAEPDAE